MNNESIPLDVEGRECIFDILCEDERGEKFLVDNRACLDYAIEKGVREGLEKGMEKGMEKGNSPCKPSPSTVVDM